MHSLCNESAGIVCKEDDLRESIKNEKYVESNEFGGHTDPYGGCGACRETERTIKIEKVYNLSDANASSSLTYLGDKPAIVDFYASWCGPCRMVAPILEELAGEYEGKIVVYKVNTEKEPDLAAAFGIRSIPSILFIPMSGKPQMLQGAMPKDAFKKAIEEYLLK